MIPVSPETYSKNVDDLSRGLVEHQYIMALHFLFIATVLSEFSIASGAFTYQNYRLVNSAFQTVHSCEWLTCILVCEASSRCRSYNYKKSTRISGETALCELNDVGLQEQCKRPENYLVYDEGFVFQQLKYEDSAENLPTFEKSLSVGVASINVVSVDPSGSTSYKTVLYVEATPKFLSSTIYPTTLGTYSEVLPTVALTSSVSRVAQEPVGPVYQMPVKNKTVLVGSEFSLKCTNAQQWTKDNSTSIPRASFSDAKTELIIHATELPDAGMYECTGINSSGTIVKSSTRIYVQESPGRSCLDIKQNFLTIWGDGEYWIDPAQDNRSFLVYCDMTTAEGGWILIYRTDAAVSENMQVDPVYSQDYRAISEFANSSSFINVNALFELRKATKFTQLRYHCRNKNKILHVMTAQNNTGEAVVNFFTQDPSTQPKACGSFVRLPDDNSVLASNCLDWGGKTDSGIGRDEWGRWDKTGVRRIYTPIWTEDHRLTINVRGIRCDDNQDATGKEASLFIR